MDETEQKTQERHSAYDAYQRVRSSSILGKLGRKVAVQAWQKTTAVVASSTIEIWGPIAIAIGVVVLFTFLIVGFAGSPAFLEVSDTTISPTPFETIAPSPTPTL